MIADCILEAGREACAEKCRMACVAKGDMVVICWIVELLLGDTLADGCWVCDLLDVHASKVRNGIKRKRCPMVWYVGIL